MSQQPRRQPSQPEFIARLEDICTRHGARPAVVTDGLTDYTYDELWEYSDQIATAVRQSVQSEEPIVGLNLPKSAKYIAAMIGVWKAGAAWVPLDPSLPEWQLQSMVADSTPELILAESSVSQIFDGRVINLNRIDDSTTESSLLTCGTFDGTSENRLAYVIYTSGTTGQPRGVAVEHRGVVNLIDNQRVAFRITPESRCLLFYPILFDASVSDIGTTILSGAALHIETELSAGNASQVLKLIKRRNITHADLPPALLQVLSLDEIPPSLQTVIIGGQACNLETARVWADRIHLVNVYGPTEATVCSSLCVCNSNWDRPLIGQPLQGIQYRIIDADLQDVPPGTTGELIIGGCCVARGYLNQPTATAQKFIRRNEQAFYRTGDAVRQDADGEYLFVGRIDRQINHNGLRIEPEEIEAIASSISGVSDAVMIRRPLHLTAGKQQLVLFVESPQDDAMEGVVRGVLESKLPSRRVPTYIHRIRELPRRPSGKPDYESLLAMGLTRNMGPPDTKLTNAERKLLDVFRVVLQNREFGADDDFVTFGGDSLNLIQASAMAAAEGVTLPSWLVMKFRTVRGICRKLDAEDQSSVGFRCSAEWLRIDASQLGHRQETRSLDGDVPESTQADAILLTGATGFLGCRVLQQLLETTDRRVVCLVREQSGRDPLERVWRHCKDQKITLNPSERKRVTVVAGDLTEHQMGLSAKDYQKLAETVGQVIHCAAEVNTIDSYGALRQPNVRAVGEVLKFVASVPAIRLDYASTLSVFAGTDRCFGHHLESDDLSATKWVFGGYAQSKFAAEILLQKSELQHERIAIHRFGLLVGDSRTGVFPSDDVLTMVIRGLVRTGCVPASISDIMFDLTPVDFAATAMATIATTKATNRALNHWHIASSRPVTARRLFQFLKQQGINLRDTSDSDFRRAALSSGDANSAMLFLAIRRWLELAEGVESTENIDDRQDESRANDLFQATDCVFDMLHTSKFLRNQKIAIPNSSSELMARCLGRLVGDSIAAAQMEQER